MESIDTKYSQGAFVRFGPFRYHLPPMTAHTLKTRFAPSPTGYIHLGNARTALFSALLARKGDGVFLLRIEDTDLERSRSEYVEALQQDLQWLGLPWQEGPGADRGNGPYFQSERARLYADFYNRLEASGQAYPCFCTPQELEMSRKAQRAAGRPPRYSGKCANLNAEEVQARLAAGLKSTLRFRVPGDRRIVFEDLVRGEQRFEGSDIGDFIIRRADGTPAFFFCNAVDDALMGVTHVLRGEDHLTNTPRQMLILEALGLPVPQYGHISMIVGPDGSPLSKRHGSRSLRELRAEGYFPQAVANYLARLGHNFQSDALLPLERLAAGFEFNRLGRAPARYDAAQLLSWQQQAVAQARPDTLWAWMGPNVEALVPAQSKEEFLQAVQPNVTFPGDAEHWARVLFTDELPLDEEKRETLVAAGTEFFRAAVAALEAHGTEFKAFAEGVKSATGAKGKQLFMPLRVALSGETGGPEMGRLLPLLGLERARRRLQAWA